MYLGELKKIIKNLPDDLRIVTNGEPSVLGNVEFATKATVEIVSLNAIRNNHYISESEQSKDCEKVKAVFIE